MKRILLKVSYDGTAYHGYQSQDNGNTIESELSRAIYHVTGASAVLIGGSRTDSGVHALSNIVVFDTDSPISAEKFSYALNAHLPQDIRVIKSIEVSLDFHPRHIDSVKTYEYRIHNSEFEDPLKRLYYLHSYIDYNIEAMKKACAEFIGKHDFSSFCSAGAQVDSKVRTIYSLDIKVIELPDSSVRVIDSISAADAPNGSPASHRKYPSRDIIISIKGNGFLYNMVRIIVGTLLEVGRGHIKSDEIKDIIEAKDRKKAGPTAPACGLCLVDYSFR